MRRTATFAAMCIASVAGAQAASDLPETYVVDDYIAHLPTGQVRMLATGLTDAHTDAMRAYDRAGLFDWAAQGDVTMGTADVIMVVRPSWADVGGFWREVGLAPVAEALPTDLISQGEVYSRTLSVQRDDGRTVRFVSFVSTFNGIDVTPECLALAVVDEFYRGPGNSDIEAIACSLQQE